MQSLNSNYKKTFNITATGFAHNNDNKPSFFSHKNEAAIWWSNSLFKDTSYHSGSKNRAIAFGIILNGGQSDVRDQLSSDKISQLSYANISSGYCIRCIKE